jgi:hypothetical protein
MEKRDRRPLHRPAPGDETEAHPMGPGLGAGSGAAAGAAIGASAGLYGDAHRCAWDSFRRDPERDPA